MGHKELNKFFEDEADRRGMTLEELSVSFGLNPNQLYTIRHGRRPGIKVCIDIAVGTNSTIGYILFLAGHVDEKLAGLIPNADPDITRIMNTLECFRDDPKLMAYAKRALMAQLDALIYSRDSD